MKVRIPIKFETDSKEETPSGVFYGKEVVEYINLTSKEAQELIQQQINKMDYDEAKDFYEKYRK